MRARREAAERAAARVAAREVAVERFEADVARLAAHRQEGSLSGLSLFKGVHLVEASLDVATSAVRNVDQTLHGTVDSFVDAGARVSKGRVLSAGAALVTGITKSGIHLAARTAKLGLAVVRRTAADAGSHIEHTLDHVSDPTVLLFQRLLAPMQSRIGRTLEGARAVRGVLNWEDPALCSWLCALLLVLTVMLAWLPWLLLMRAVGAILFGPHMLVFGRRRREAAEEATGFAKTAQRYAQVTDEAVRRRLLDEECCRRERRAQTERRAEARSRRALPFAEYAERRKAYKHARHIEVEGSRFPSQERFATQPDPARARMRPWSRVASQRPG